MMLPGMIQIVQYAFVNCPKCKIYLPSMIRVQNGVWNNVCWSCNLFVREDFGQLLFGNSWNDPNPMTVSEFERRLKLGAFE